MRMPNFQPGAALILTVEEQERLWLMSRCPTVAVTSFMDAHFIGDEGKQLLKSFVARLQAPAGDSAMSMAPEQQARHDLMLTHLREAVRLGFSISVPGEHDAVREAFPDVFAAPEDLERGPDFDDGPVSTDPHPMVSRGEAGHWVSAWVWIERPEPETCDNCGELTGDEIKGCPDGREICLRCFESGVG